MQIPGSRKSSLLKLVGGSLAVLSMIVGVIQLATPTVHATNCYGLGYSCRVGPAMCGTEAEEDGVPFLICMGSCNNASSLPWCTGYPGGAGPGPGCPGDPNCTGKTRRPN